MTVLLIGNVNTGSRKLWARLWNNLKQSKKLGKQTNIKVYNILKLSDISLESYSLALRSVVNIKSH